MSGARDFSAKTSGKLMGIASAQRDATSNGRLEPTMDDLKKTLFDRLRSCVGTAEMEGAIEEGERAQLEHLIDEMEADPPEKEPPGWADTPLEPGVYSVGKGTPSEPMLTFVVPAPPDRPSPPASEAKEGSHE